MLALPIAIVAVSVRLPDGTVDWRGLTGPRPTVAATRVAPWDRPDLEGWTAAWLIDPWSWSPAAFGIAASEARRVDPTHRRVLEGAREVVEGWGRTRSQLAGRPIGTWTATGLVDGAQATMWPREAVACERVGAWGATASLPSVAAGRVQHAMDWRGPAVAVDTACSSALTAMAGAIEALRAGRVEAALVAAVNCLLRPEPFRAFERLGALSPTGTLRPFDAAADGYVRAEAAVSLMLRRLDDAVADGDPILGVVHGIGTNHDGTGATLTSPNPSAQAAAMEAALRDGGLTPNDVGWVEAHGTGTPLGDAIEASSLARVFGARSLPLWVTAAKGRHGHAEAAAGAVGVAEVLGALNRGALAPTPNHVQLNPRISWNDGPIQVAIGGEVPAAPFAAVSAFGLSGTNVVAILGPAPQRTPRRPSGPMVVGWSAPTPTAAAAMASSLLGQPIAAASALTGRRADLAYRAFAVGGADERVPEPVVVRRAQSSALALAFTGGSTPLEPPGPHEGSLAERLAAAAGALGLPWPLNDDSPPWCRALAPVVGDLLTLMRHGADLAPDFVLSEGLGHWTAGVAAGLWTPEQALVHALTAADPNAAESTSFTGATAACPWWTVGNGTPHSSVSRHWASWQEPIDEALAQGAVILRIGPDRPELRGCPSTGPDARSSLVALAALWAAGAPVNLPVGPSPDPGDDLPATPWPRSSASLEFDVHLWFVDDAHRPPTLLPCEPVQGRGPKSAVVLGASGAIGRAAARHLVDLGTRRLWLVSRTPSPDVELLRRAGCDVESLAIDLSEAGGVNRVLAKLDPDTVAIHAAGTERGGGQRAVWEETLTAFAVAGRRVAFASSISALWGDPARPDYAEGHRRALDVVRSHPNLRAVALGPVRGGLANDDALAALGPLGFVPLDPDDVASALVAALDQPESIRALVAGHPTRLLQTLRAGPAHAWLRRLGAEPVPEEAAIASAVAAVLGRMPAADQGLFDAGLDSVGAVELASRIGSILRRPPDPTWVFANPTLSALQSLARAPSSAPAPRVRGEGPVAVVGAAVRLPGADGLDAFQALLEAGTSAIGPAPRGRGWVAGAAGGLGWGGAVDAPFDFDAASWALRDGEANAIDPQQRWLLEAIDAALTSAGIQRGALAGSRTGIWLGVGRPEWSARAMRPESPSFPWAGSGTASSFAAGRAAWLLGTTGPAMTVDTACSSSLVAVWQAIEALRGGDVDRAIVGGATAVLDPAATQWVDALGALSPTGRLRPFRGGDGYLRGEGAAVLVLERASADRPAWCWIHGAAVNHDGHSAGLTVPIPGAQSDVIRAALDDAGAQADDVVYIETHGTGTALGDPIEARALVDTFGPRPIGLGTLKALIGHTEAAAGAASLVKIALCALRGEFPSGGDEPVDPSCRPDGWAPWTDGRPWQDGLVGISAFGLSGTNAHAIVGRAPLAAVRHPVPVPKRGRFDLGADATPVFVPAGTPLTATQGRPRARIVTTHPALEGHVDHDPAGPVALRVVADGDLASTAAALAAFRDGPALWWLPPSMAALTALAATAEAERGERISVVVSLDPEHVARALAAGSHRAIAGQEIRWIPAASCPRADLSGTWLVVGAGAALAKPLVGHLRDRGAERIVGLARRQVTLEGAETRIVDFADVAAVRLATADLANVAGLVHLAADAAPAWLPGLTADHVRLALAAKIDTLQAVLETVRPERAWLFGSALAHRGRSGQAAYGIANAALEVAADSLRARGIRATAFAFGPWNGLGLAAGTSDWGDVRPRDVDAQLAALDQADALDVSPVLILDAAPTASQGTAPAPQRAAKALPLEAVLDAIERLLGTRPDPDRGLLDAGMDSVGAVALARDLSLRTGADLAPTVVFDHPTARRLHAAIAGIGTSAPLPAPPQGSDHAAIAVVAVSLRLPRAGDLHDLASLLESGTRPSTAIPADRWPAEPGPAGFGVFLDDVANFDPIPYGLTAAEAARMDPQQRLLLDLAHDVFTGRRVPADTGVFVGAADRGWLRRFAEDPRALYPDSFAGTGAEPAFGAGRVAHTFGLTGPVLTVDTTCSSALVAVHLAVTALRRGECSSALAGGVSLMWMPDDSAYLARLGALSPTGACHAFRADADGYVRAEGAGLFLLRRLDDARRDGDPVVAIIAGSAIRHDGTAAALTAPSGTAQEATLRAALADADWKPEDVVAIEAHGTGTTLGDPIEAAAIGRVYGGGARPVVVGAVKAHLGHAELAAGVAGLARAIASLHSPHWHSLPPGGPINEGARVPGVDIATTARTWPVGPRRAGVSSFGLSGTNAHILLERGPDAPVRRTRPLAFVCTGQGALAADALDRAAALHPDAAAVVAWAEDMLEDVLGGTLRARLSDPDGPQNTAIAQPALVAIGLAQIAALRAHHIEPTHVLGHSAGEVVAAAVAGVLPPDAALRFAAARGAAMAKSRNDHGMVALAASLEAATALLPPGTSIANHNAPDEVVVAGDVTALDELSRRASQRGLLAKRLPLHHGFHSAAMDDVLPEIRAGFATVAHAASPPRARFLCLTTVRYDVDWGDPDRWAQAARAPVRFVDGIRKLREEGVSTFVEIGPAAILSGLIARIDPRAIALPMLRRGQDDGLATVVSRLQHTRPQRLWPEGDRVARALTHLTIHWQPVATSATDGPVDRSLMDVDAKSLGPRLLALAERISKGHGATFVLCRATTAAGCAPSPAQAALWAFLRSARLERPDVDIRLVDVDQPNATVLVPTEGEPDVAVREGRVYASRVSPTPRRDPALPDATFVIGGASGGVARSVALDLLGRGVRRFHLVSRKGAADLATALRAGGATVMDEEGAVPGDWPDGPVIALHLAGATRPAALPGLVRADVEAVLGPKMSIDAWLARAAQAPNVRIVAASTAAAWWGAGRLASYAAANAYLAAAVAAEGSGRHRAVALGPIAGGGMIDAERAATLAEHGLHPMSPLAVVDAVLGAMASPEPYLVANIDWALAAPLLAAGGPFTSPMLARRPVLASPKAGTAPPIDEAVWAAVRAVVREPAKLTVDTPLHDVGYDSLAATELKAKLLDDGIDAPMGRLLGGPSIAEIVAMVAPVQVGAHDNVTAPVENEYGAALIWSHVAAAIVGFGVCAATYALWGAFGG